MQGRRRFCLNDAPVYRRPSFGLNTRCAGVALAREDALVSWAWGAGGGSSFGSRAETPIAFKLQKPLPDEGLGIVAKGEKANGLRFSQAGALGLGVASSSVALRAPPPPKGRRERGA